MIEKSIVVKRTLDTRNAALFVQTASKFSSSVKVAIEDKLVNAKICPGTMLKLTASGDDEQEAVEEIAGILE